VIDLLASSYDETSAALEITPPPSAHDVSCSNHTSMICEPHQIIIDAPTEAEAASDIGGMKFLRPDKVCD
jgi:hypothetical protein